VSGMQDAEVTKSLQCIEQINVKYEIIIIIKHDDDDGDIWKTCPPILVKNVVVQVL